MLSTAAVPAPAGADIPAAAADSAGWMPTGERICRDCDSSLVVDRLGRWAQMVNDDGVLAAARIGGGRFAVFWTEDLPEDQGYSEGPFLVAADGPVPALLKFVTGDSSFGSVRLELYLSSKVPPFAHLIKHITTAAAGQAA